MNKAELNGTVYKVLEEQTFSEKFTKQDVIIQTPEPYSQLIAVQFVNDNITKIRKLQEGQEISVECNVRGREWTSQQGEVKYFVSLEGWKVNVAGSTEKKEDVKHHAPDESDGDDLPF